MSADPGTAPGQGIAARPGGELVDGEGPRRTARSGNLRVLPAGDGILVVDKPAGWTSHDVVARLRRLAGTRRVGHAGTLDPMATGVLVVGVNRATRLLAYASGADKDYTATIRLGIATTTDDAEGEVLAGTAWSRPTSLFGGTTAQAGVPGLRELGGRTAGPHPTRLLDSADPQAGAPELRGLAGAPGVGMVLDAGGQAEAAIRAGVARLTGAIDQVPSAVSAIKVNGQRAYARVRAGEAVELAPRRVVVTRFDVLAVRAGVAGGTPRADGEMGTGSDVDDAPAVAVISKPGDIYRGPTCGSAEPDTRHLPARIGPGQAGGVPVIDVDVAVTVSSGTYVRALARDLGAALGVGGHLTALRRTRVGGFALAQAYTLDALAARHDAGEPLPLLDLAGAARAMFPERVLTDAEAQAISHGGWIAPSGMDDVVAGTDAEGHLIALMLDSRRDDRAFARPVTGFTPAPPHSGEPRSP